MLKELDENITVIFRKEEWVLKDVLGICQPGETIEGVPVECFNALLIRLDELRGKEYSYSTDRRYGKWRFLLFGERD